jgi:hypothetical protein
MKSHVAIVGFSPTKNEAPFDNPDWDIYTLNHRIDLVPRFDLWFNLHNLYNIKNEFPKFYNYFSKPENESKLVICGEDKPCFPNAIIYPKDEVLNKYCKFVMTENQGKIEKETRLNFVTNSISWMIAYAIEQGYTNIGLWGVDMAASSEYQFQLPNLLFWMGVCAGKGIKLHIPEECKLILIKQFYWNLSNG